MSNMSYCRFRNTSRDLIDCKEALEALLNGSSEEGPLSEDELHAAVKLISTCCSIVALVAEHLDIDADALLDFDHRMVFRKMLDTANAEAKAAEARNG